MCKDKTKVAFSTDILSSSSLRMVTENQNNTKISVYQRLIQLFLLDEARKGLYKYETTLDYIYEYLQNHKEYYESRGYKLEFFSDGVKRVVISW